MGKAGRKLIDGRNMCCPRCKLYQPVESYMRMEESTEFELETTPIYKCPKCRWLFAPSDPTLPVLMQDLLDEITSLRAELNSKES